MTDWGEPELVGICDALPPEFNVLAAGGAPGAPPVLGRLFVARVNEVEIGRYLAMGGIAPIGPGMAKFTGSPVTDVTFNYVNADGASNAALFDSLPFPAEGRVDWAPEASAPATGPTFPLGPLDVFASPAELAPHIGQVVGAAQERRSGMALLTATRYVLFKLGYSFDEDTIPPDPAPLDVVPVAVRASWHDACLIAAVRYWNSPSTPFGVTAGWDMATYVRWSIPDADLVLLGERQRFGIA